MTLDIHNSFTEIEYARLLELAAKRYTFVHYDETSDGPVVIWRHDIDYSPHRALSMASMEAERSLKCIYHLLLNGRYYNLFEPEVIEILKKIAKLGHVLGLHFDMDGIQGEEVKTPHLLERIDFEKRTIETLLGVPLKSISFHNYVLNRSQLLRDDTIHGMVNVVSPAIWDGYKYVSDSNGIWRRDRLKDILLDEPVDRLHVLTHPIWWTKTPQTPIARLKRVVDGRARAGFNFYTSILKRDGRYEHIADQIGLEHDGTSVQPTGQKNEVKTMINVSGVGSTDTSERFRFGCNWANYARRLSQDQIDSATQDLSCLLKLGSNSLNGSHFLDIGSGSGLSSLAALRLGARVHSFDYDSESVETTRTVLRTYAPDSNHWQVASGSVLDEAFMTSLGQFDVVYSWGVLHHTGNMWRALDLAAECVIPGGKLAIAIYNDQGGASRRWRSIKHAYIRSPKLIKAALVALVGMFFELRAMIIRSIRLQNPLPFEDWRKRRQERGMSVFHDLVDWVGGYPFEVAKPEAVIDCLHGKGFQLDGLKTCAGGHGCNEYLFVRRPTTLG